MKSGGEFEDILAQDNPAIWHTNRPAKGGDTGAMFAQIIERAARLKASRSTSTQNTAPSGRIKDTTRSARTTDTRGTKDAKGKTVRAATPSKAKKNR